METRIVESLAILDSAIDFPEGEDYNLNVIVKNLEKLIQTAEKAMSFLTLVSKPIMVRI